MRIQAFLEIGSVEYILLLIVFLVLVAIMYRLGRRASTPTRADELKTRYAHLTAGLLAETPDDQLVEAVVANLMAKADEKNPDLYYMVMAMSHGRRAVYSVWLTVKELTAGTLEDYRKGLSARFAEPAADGLKLIGADACGMLLGKAMEAETPDELLTAAFRDAVKQEDPLALAAAYIRQNPEDFTDEEPVEE